VLTHCWCPFVSIKERCIDGRRCSCLVPGSPARHRDNSLHRNGRGDCKSKIVKGTGESPAGWRWRFSGESGFSVGCSHVAEDVRAFSPDVRFRPTNPRGGSVRGLPLSLRKPRFAIVASPRCPRHSIGTGTPLRPTEFPEEPNKPQLRVSVGVWDCPEHRPAGHASTASRGSYAVHGTERGVGSAIGRASLHTAGKRENLISKKSWKKSHSCS
jgi:hypothetical protein